MNNETPANSNGVATNPPPQTVAGTLDQIGSINSLTPLPGNKVDLEWMFNRPRYIGKYTVAKSNAADSTVAVIRPFSLRDNISSITSQHWHEMLLSMARFWNGCIVWRFYMVKPLRVVGRLIVEYRPDAYLTTTTWSNCGESQQRHIVKEWDLSKSDFVDLCFTGYNSAEWRPTKVPFMRKTGTNRTLRLASRLPLDQYFAGTFRLSVAQPIQPGSVFPDSYDIIAEVFLKDVQIAERSDCKYTTTPSVSVMTFALSNEAITLS